MNCWNFKKPIPTISTLSKTSFIMPVTFIKGIISNNTHLMVVRMKKVFLGSANVIKRLTITPMRLPNCLMMSRKPRSIKVYLGRWE